MGTVYHCHNPLVPGIEAAVKTMDPSLARSVRSRKRFIREAEVLFSLDHPHIVKVRNVQMDHDPPFLEMEFVAGQSLGALLNARSFARGAATSLAAQLASAVHYLHSRGVFHRDIKPDNIIFADERATLVDFGLVSEDHRATLNRPGALFGTLQYVPPEWGGATRPDGASWDRYSLGVVIYEAFTGEPAFASPPVDASFIDQLTMVQDQKRARPFLDLGPEVPPAIRELVRLLTAVEPADRACDLAAAAAVLVDVRARMSPTEAARTPFDAPPPIAAKAATTVELPLYDMAVVNADSTQHRVPDDGTVPVEATTHKLPSADATGEAWPTLVPSDSAHVSMVDAPPVEAPPRRFPWVPALVGLALVLGLAVVFWPSRAPTPVLPPVVQSWPLQLVLTPDAPPLPVRLTLDDVVVVPDPPPSVSPGPHTLVLRIGQDCGGGTLPEHCAELVESFAVDDSGTGAHRRVRLPEVVPRTASFASPHTADLRVKLPDLPWTDTTPRPTAEDLLPGRYSAIVQAGDCPDDSCADACPSTCAEQVVDFVVPFQDSGNIDISVDIQAPEPPKAARPPGLMSVGRFVRWLDQHPEYQPGGARTTGLSTRYLRGWSGSTPPATLASGAPIDAGTPVEAVAPGVAERACAGRGGLLSVDAAPGSWAVPDGGPVPWFEIRAGAAGPVLLQSDGTVLPVQRGDARPMVGFRCAR